MLHSFILFIVIWATTVSIVKHVEKNVIVSNFTNQAILKEDLSTSNLKMYEVKGNEELSTYIKKGNKIIPGNILYLAIH